MRFLIKVPLLALFCLFAADSIIPTFALAGSAPVTPPGSGASGVGDTFTPNDGNSSGVVTTRITSGFSNTLQSIQSRQSVPSVNGNTVPVSPGQLDAIAEAISFGRGIPGISTTSGAGLSPGSSSNPSAGAPSGSENSTAESSGSGNAGASTGTTAGTDSGTVGNTVRSEIRPGATNAGGSIFGLRNSDIDSEASSSAGGATDAGGSIFGLRNSDIDNGDSGSDSNGGSDEVSGSGERGSSVFSLRDDDFDTEAGGRDARAARSPEAQSAINALEQQLLAETGLNIQVTILNASTRNFSRAVAAANGVIAQLNSEQLAAVTESPTLLSILSLLGNVDLIVGEDGEATLVIQDGSGLGIPLLSLLDVES